MTQANRLDEFGNPIEDDPMGPSPRLNATPGGGFAPTSPYQPLSPTPGGGFSTSSPFANQSAPSSGGGFDRTKFRDAWMSSNGSLDDFIKNNPSFSAGVTTSKDRATLPTGEVLDLVGDVGGRNSHEWTGTGRNAQGVPDQPGGFGGVGGFGGSGNTGITGGSAFQDQIRGILLDRMKTLGAPVDANDPTIAAQTAAYRTDRERAGAQERAALAERDAAEGLNSGGQGSGSFDTGVQGINEQVGQDVSGRKADLMGEELKSRRQSMQTLLSMALQTGDAESARALQLQIAQMDSELRKMGLSQSQSQFDDRLGYDQSRTYSDDQYRNAVLAAMGVA